MTRCINHHASITLAVLGDSLNSFILSYTVAYNCHIKYKLLTSNTNYSHQIQITHIKYKLLTSNTNYSHQIQITHIKYKLPTSNTNYPHQIQITHIKYKLLTSNTNRYINWSAAKSMNAIPSVYSVFHFTAILCDRCSLTRRH